MDVFLPAINASPVDASITAYGTGLYSSLSIYLHIAVFVETPTYHSVTIWTSLFVPLMLVIYSFNTCL
jgi:hypothetical protein